MPAPRGVERRLAHQAVHAGLGAQEAERVFAFDLDRCALDAGHVAFGLFQHFGLEALAFAVLQVLAQQHRRPVARLGAAGAGLDVDEAIGGVHRAREHAAEFHVFDDGAHAGGVGLDGFDGVVVAFLAGQLEQLGGAGEVCVQLGQRQHDVLKRFLLAAQFLGAFRVVPDLGVFELFVDFG